MGTLVTAPRVVARVPARPEPPYDRVHDRLVAELLHGGPVAEQRFPVRWPDTDALKRLADAKRAPLPRELADAMRAYHVARGASPASLANLDRLARGEAVAAVAGQQPAPLGGPLYSIHKTASAVGLAADVERRTGVPCVPLFWMHGEDSDFAEIRSATYATAALELRDTAIAADATRDGALVGGIPVAALAAAEAPALAAWEGLAGAGDARALVDGAIARAGDLGEAHSALMLALFADAGLVVIDPRLPEFRAAARPLIERYLANAAAFSDAIRTAGAWLEREAGRRPLADTALDSLVFALRDGTRQKIGPAEARAAGAAQPLSPSVALRPAVQDGVFPTVAMACGAGEVAYLAQLREVFELLGVRAACPVPRLSATWLPAAAIELIDATGADPWDVVAATDRVLREHAERALPPAVRGELEAARGGTFAALERLSQATRELDASLPQAVESARGKIDFQFARIAETLAGKMRHQLDRRHPEWPRLRYYLLPGDRLQERRLCSLEPVARLGAGVAAGLCALATEQAARFAAGAYDHLLLEA